jgi:glycosyltransferase involved in cell wall biosynthesis
MFTFARMPVSLILPCYKPQQGWDEIVLREYALFCEAIQQTVELIIVFDGQSDEVTDGTIDKLKKNILGLVIISYPNNMGKGYATRKGIAAATGEIMLYTDVDFPYSTESMALVFNKLYSKECDIAVGIKNEDYYRHVPAARRTISKGLRLLTGGLLSMPVTDTQCGLKGFNQVAKVAFLHTTINRYLFDLEFIYKSYRSGAYKIAAIPVALKEGTRFRKMNYRILLPEMLNFLRLLTNRKS